MSSIVSALRFPSVLFGRKPSNTPDAPEVSTEREAEGTQAERNVGEAIHPIDAITGFTSKAARASARPLPLIQGLKFSQQVRVLSIVVAIFLALAVVALGLSMRDTRLSRAQALVSNEMQVLSQRIAILAQQAVQGDASAFKALEDAGAQLAADLALLRDGGERNGIGIPTPSDKDYGKCPSRNRRGLEARRCADCHHRGTAAEPPAASETRGNRGEERGPDPGFDATTRARLCWPERGHSGHGVDQTTVCRYRQIDPVDAASIAVDGPRQPTGCDPFVSRR